MSLWRPCSPFTLVPPLAPHAELHGGRGEGGEVLRPHQRASGPAGPHLPPAGAATQASTDQQVRQAKPNELCRVPGPTVNPALGCHLVTTWNVNGKPGSELRIEPLPALGSELGHSKASAFLLHRRCGCENLRGPTCMHCQPQAPGNRGLAGTCFPPPAAPCVF